MYAVIYPANVRLVRVQTPPEVAKSYNIELARNVDISPSDIIYEDWRDAANYYTGEAIPPPRRINATPPEPRAIRRLSLPTFKSRIRPQIC